MLCTSTRVTRVIGGGGLLAGTLVATPAAALPSGPPAFCDAYPDAPTCDGGLPDCGTCHETPPARNLLGLALEPVLLPDEPRPLSPEDFAEALPEALAEIEQLDTDDDGTINLDEWLAGSDAADADSIPGADVCSGDPDKSVWRYDVCQYDARFTLNRVMVDFCGRSPTYAALEAIETEDDPQAIIHQTLDECLQTEYWRGRDGVLWQIAHTKIRPSAALKGGEDGGDIPLGDYEDDYNLFVYTQIDGRDARELLTAQYHVERDDQIPTTYTPYTRGPVEDAFERGGEVAQFTPIERRAGMLTTRWNFVTNTMFTAIPRTTAAAAYRSYLGLDIARMEGLQDVAGEPVDHDDKGVDAPECAVCHATLDPLTYPFSRYVGLGGGLPGDYQPGRMLDYVGQDGLGILATPESGSLFGEPVADLLEWAQVAANSDPFAQATVMDYWAHLLGEPPRPSDTAEFTALWSDFASVHGYRIDDMLHDLIDTEAYSVP